MLDVQLHGNVHMMLDTLTSGLWPDIHFFERGWLSANNILFTSPQGAVLVDTGYYSHAEQTLALVQSVLQDQPHDQLRQIINTHLHSDHCGGNATLQAAWPQVQTWVAPGQAAYVTHWDPVALSYVPTGQICPRFKIDGILQPGTDLCLGEHCWQVHAAPGHDPHAIILFEPQRRILIAGDALWSHGFGVVFPEIEGIRAFDEVGQTLDVIESLEPCWILPGHGPMFTDVTRALTVARKRLGNFKTHPLRHALYAAKVLLKYKLLEWQHMEMAQVRAWCIATPYVEMLRAQYFSHLSAAQWCDKLVEELIASKAAQRQQEILLNC